MHPNDQEFLPRFSWSPRSAVSRVRCEELEEVIGVRLLSRTIRSVSLTDAGAHLQARLYPAFTEIQDALARSPGFEINREAAYDCMLHGLL
jgi:DNA-binding transcriptional LysR family regulator